MLDINTDQNFREIGSKRQGKNSSIKYIDFLEEKVRTNMPNLIEIFSGCRISNGFHYYVDYCIASPVM